MMDQSESVRSSTDRLHWYQEAKFGMFIHWGAYSAAGVEASRLPGGGFAFNTIHNVLPDVPPENIMAMFEAVDEYR